MKTKRQYVCAECGKPVIMSGTGLKTSHCPSHPSRTVSVTRDLSGGKESERSNRQVMVSTRRATKVRVILTKGDNQ